MKSGKSWLSAILAVAMVFSFIVFPGQTAAASEAEGVETYSGLPEEADAAVAGETAGSVDGTYEADVPDPDTAGEEIYSGAGDAAADLAGEEIYSDGSDASEDSAADEIYSDTDTAPEVDVADEEYSGADAAGDEAGPWSESSSEEEPDIGENSEEDSPETYSIEESALPAIYTAYDSGVEVSVTVPSHALPENAELSVTILDHYVDHEDDSEEDAGEDSEEDSEIDSGQAGESAQEAEHFTFSAGEEEESESGTIVLDISFYADGEAVEPTEPAEVVIDASGLLAGAGEVIESIEVWHDEDGNGLVLVDEVADPDEAANGIARFSVDSFSEFEFHYNRTGSGWAGFGANLFDENNNTISATVSGYDSALTDGRYTTTVDMPHTFTIDEFAEHFNVSGSYTFMYATVSDPNYGDTSHEFDEWDGEVTAGTNEVYGNEDNPVTGVSIDATDARSNLGEVSKTWHFTLIFEDGDSVTIPIYGNADGADDNGGKYCPKFLEINLYYKEDIEAVLNLGNGNGTYSDGDYTGSNASGGDALRYGTGALGNYVVNGKVTINLPSDDDLDTDFTVVDAIGTVGEEGYQPEVTIELGNAEAYDYKLIGWINIATGDYYDVSNGSAAAEIDPSDDNVFYADWIGADYDRGSSSYDGLKDTVSTSSFVTLQMFDFNELFNLYSVSLEQNGTSGETWTDSGSFYSEPLLGNDADTMDPIADSFIFQNNGTTRSNVHVLSHANPQIWNIWTANAAWSGQPEYNFVLDASKYWNITSPDSTILGMLYDKNESSLGVHYVGEADNLFWIDDEGYYIYDSNQSGAAYNQSDGRFYVYDYDEYDRKGFFPYNNTRLDGSSENNGLTDYWFGMCMEVNIYLPSATNAGTKNNPVNQVNDEDMVFDFFGDDDIIIFIDDQMVVDMSGIHGQAYSRINFADNTVSISMGLDEYGAPDTTGASGKYSENDNLNLSAGPHTMKIYYMERGASASNLKIRFNVASTWQYETGPVQTVTAGKVWETGEGTVITDTTDMPDVEIGLFDALGPADGTDGTFGYTQDGTKYTVIYDDDSGIRHTYVYDSAGGSGGPTLTYTEGEEEPVIYDETNSSGQVVDEAGHVIAWLDGETLHIRIDRQTLGNDNDWTYTWELLDADGDYEVRELSEDSRYTTDGKKDDLTSHLYWSIIGDVELEEMFEEGSITPIILTEAAQEAADTLGDTKEAKGYVIVATENGVETKTVAFSQIAELQESDTSKNTNFKGTYGVTSQSEIEALGSGAVWYPVSSGDVFTDINGDEIQGFYLYCELDSGKYYLRLNDEGNGLTVTDDEIQKGEFYYDLLGEFMVARSDNAGGSAGDPVRVEIDENGTIAIGSAEFEAAKDDVRIYTLSETKTSGFAFTAINTLLCEFQLTKVETGKEDAVLDGATFALYRDENCTEPIGFTVAEVADEKDGEETVRTVYTVSDDTEADTYTEEITAGSVTIAGIGSGTYYLKELTAPKNDYVHLNEVIVITVSNESEDGSPTETKVDGAPKHVTADGDTVIVQNDPRGTTQVPVQKVWDDANDQDGVRPASITFHLFADGKEALDENGVPITATVTEANGWAYTFTDLPLYESEDENDQDVAIVYTVIEDPIEGYTSTVTGDQSGYTVTNSYTPATTKVTVTKKWEDGQAIQPPPDSIEVQLYADGTATGDPVTLSGENEWTYTWTKLPVYSSGKKIEYTVKEADVAGYTPSYGETTWSEEDESYSITITNTPTPVKLSIQKTVAGTTETTEYEFRITLKSGDTAYNGDIAVTCSDGTTETYDMLTFTDGAADVRIGAGDTITLTLVYGMSWEVTELTDGADSTVIYVDNEIVDAASGTIEEDTPVRFVNSYRGYFPIDEEIVPDYTDRTTWVKEEAVNEYNAIEIEMSTLLPVITSYDLENGSFTMNFHEILDHELNLDEADADFAVYIAGYKVDHKYYEVTISPDDECSFHVDVNLTALYNDGVITEEELQGDTEIMIFFFADLEGTDLNGTYKSTVWYDVYDGENWEYTSNVDVVDVYTYEISILKYDASTLEDDDYDGSALAGAMLGVYYDPECTDPVSRNGEPYTVTSGYDGRAIFYGLADGTYYVKETEPPVGYVLSDKVLTVELGEDLNDTGYMYSGVFANIPETTDVSGSKTWDDADDQDGVRPESITVNLLADGEPAGSVTVTEADGWAWNFTDLPVYKNGAEIVYSFAEEAVERYEADYDGYDVINTHIPEVTEVSGGKTWDDADDQDGKRPESITVNLLADGEKTDSVNVTAADNWCWSFTDLPKYRDGGVEIVYTVTEDTVGDYTTVIDGYDITNSYTPGKTGLNVQKIWDDSDDQDGIRPESVTVELLKNGEKTGDTLTLDESNGWSGSFTDLDEYTDGVKNEYTAEEVPVDGYDAAVTSDGDTAVSIIKNTHIPETTEVSGSKTWDDMDDQDGKRPESITISLLADGEPAGSVTVTAKDDWSWSFTNLPVYRNGEEIVYSITEDEVPGYTTSYNGYDVVNHYVPATVSVPVEKKWDDDNNAAGARPNSVVVELLKNGESTGRVLILGEENGWSGSFDNLDEYTAGTKNVYTVRELDVEGYTAGITGDAETGYVITNTYSPDIETEPGPEIPPDDGNPDTGNPNTGNPDTGNPDNGNPETQTGPGPVVENPSTGGTTGAKTADTNAPILSMFLVVMAGAAIMTLGLRRRFVRK